MISTADLPDDMDALKAMIVAQSERNDRLETLVAALRQALFGRKSEKSDPAQFELALEDLETGIAEVEAEREADPAGAQTRTSKPRATNRGALPKHLPRIEEAIQPDSTICRCGTERHVIGEDVSERLDLVPARFRVIVTRRPKYACRSCEDGIVQAAAPAHLIPGGMPTEATIAHVIVSKYADHLPLNRQAQIYGRQGIELDRSTLADWVGRAAFELRPVFDALIADLKKSPKLFMDETRAPVLDPGRGKTKTGYFRALARDDRAWGGDDPPGVAFTFAPGRSGQYADQILQDFRGILQVSFRPIAAQSPVGQRTGMPAGTGCSGGRHGIFSWHTAGRMPGGNSTRLPGPEPHQSPMRGCDRSQPSTGSRKMSAVKAPPGGWRHDRNAPSQPLRHSGHGSRQTVRGCPPNPPVGEALKYIAKYWDGLCLFLTDGRIEMDSNPVERTIRPIALNRKNVLFAGHDAGARNWAIMASLIETCKLNAVDPHDWLTETLTAIVNGQRQANIKTLLPWNHQPKV